MLTANVSMPFTEVLKRNIVLIIISECSDVRLAQEQA